MQKICIIHVGSIVNKGTHALVTSEIEVIRRALGCADVVVSTLDVDSFSALEPNVKAVPPILDIPYVRADSLCARMRIDRRSIGYKLLVLVCLLLVFWEMPVSLLSSFVAKVSGKPFFRASTISNIRNASLVVSTSDENFKEGCTFLPFNLTWRAAWWSMLFSRMWEVTIAKRIFNRPIIVFPNSLGPFRTLPGRMMAKVILSNVNYVFLREQDSMKYMASLGTATPYRVVCDIALLQEGDVPRMGNRLESRPLLGVSLGIYDAVLGHGEWLKLARTFAEVIDALIEKHGFRAVFLPHEVTGLPRDDLDFSRTIMEEMRCEEDARIVSVKSLEEFRVQLSHFDMLVTSRLHPAILASALCIPSISIVYDHKQTGFLGLLGLERCGIRLTEVTKPKLLALFGLVWKDRDSVRNTLQRTVPQLRRTAFEHIRETTCEILECDERSRACTSCS